MSFIPGRFISKLVKEQLDARQALLNQSDRLSTEGVSADAFSFFTRKVPFIRMTSAINIKGSSDPAANHVLDSGVTASTGDTIPGYEESPTLGIRPKPGIVSMNLRTHNRFGSLRTATIEFKVHSVEQLDTYEELYLRPGHTALVEWGNSLYLDSDSKEVKEVPVLLSEDFLNQSNGLNSKLAIYNRIKELREEYHFNYDAMYGQVKNFSWRLRADGGYDCTVDVVSIGNVLESMTLNVSILPRDLTQFRKLKLEQAEEIKFTLPSRTVELEVDSTEGKGLNQGEDSLYKNVIEPILDKALSPVRRESFFGLSTNEYGGYELVAKTGITPAEVMRTQKFDSKAQVLGITAGETDDIAPQGFTIVTTGYRQDVVNSVSSIEQTGEYQKLLNASFISYADPSIEYYIEPIASDTIVIGGESRGDARYRLFTIVYALKTRPATEALAGPSQASEEVIPGPYSENLASYEQVAEAYLDLVDRKKNFLDSILREVNDDVQSRLHFFLFILNTYIRSNIDLKKDYRGNSTSELLRYKEQNIPLDSLGLPFTSEYKQGLRRAKITPKEEGQQITSDDFYNYIQLGTFIDMLNYFLPTVNNQGEKLFAFHTDKRVIHRHKTLPNLHTSVDISKCLLPQSYKLSGNFIKRGDILDIFIEIDYLREIITRNLTAGDIKVYDIVTAILGDIVTCTGQINNFELQYFEETGKFHIVDRELIDPISQRGNIIPKLDVIGKKSTVLNLDLVSKLSPAIGSQIAIAAQSDPFSNGIESSGWADFNRGLIDRYNPFKSSDADSDLKNAINAQEKRERLQRELGVAFKYLTVVYGSSEFEQVVTSLPMVLTPYATLCKIRVAELTGEGGKRFGIIIPYELGLTLEGMSGFNVMESFSINDEILPRSYRNEDGGGVAFLITGLQHNISANGWTTTIQSQIYNTSKNGALVEGKLLPELTPQPAPSPQPEETPDRSNSSDLGAACSVRGTRYPELPYQEIPPRTQMSYEYVTNYLTSRYSEKVSRAVFAIIWSEASRDYNKNLFNSAGGHNYSGVQTDNKSRWNDGAPIIGQFCRRDAVEYRSFAIFPSDEAFLDFMADRVTSKDIDGTNVDKWVVSYIRRWWWPKAPAEYSNPTNEVYKTKKSFYESAMRRYDRFA